MEINQIYQGDCLEILDSLKLQGIELDDCIFVSDPPFNIKYNYREYKDNLPEDSYYEWLQSVFGNHQKVIVHYPEALYKFAFQVGEFPERVISWVYNSNTAKQHRDIAFFGVKPDLRKVGQPYKNPTDKRIKKRISEGKSARLYDWWEINQVKNVSKKHSHPCEMPLEVMKRIIGVLPENKIIIDPFMGTGTTGLACKELGRSFIGIELDNEYFKIAEKRLTQDNLFSEVNNQSN
jgi:site-specific DNA-methyltransferase (adenine-specific)